MPIWKGYKVYDSLWHPREDMKNYRNSENIGGFLELGRDREEESRIFRAVEVICIIL